MVFQMRAGLGSMTQQRIRLPDAKDDISSSESKGQSVRSGGKAGQKFSSKDGIAPGYRLSPDHFQKIKRMLAPDWAQKMLVLLCPIDEHISWVLFVCSYSTASYCLAHGLSCSRTKEMHTVRKLSVWYKIPIWFQNSLPEN